jgi:hypothetical protein
MLYYETIFAPSEGLRERRRRALLRERLTAYPSRMDPGIADVSDTALWIAAYRARETERAGALFHDPLAGRLAGDRRGASSRGR